MQKIKALLLLLTLTIISEAIAANASIKVIYGEDNRKDPFEVSNSLFVELAKSTAAMIPHSKISSSLP